MKSFITAAGVYLCLFLGVQAAEEQFDPPQIAPRNSALVYRDISAFIDKADKNQVADKPDLVLQELLAQLQGLYQLSLEANREKLVVNVAAEALRLAKESALREHPVPDTGALRRQAEAMYPAYRVGDTVEFLYDPTSRRMARGKVKAVNANVVVLNFNDQYSLRDIIDPKIREAFFPEKVAAARLKFVEDALKQHDQAYRVAVLARLQPNADEIVAANEKLGFLYRNGEWQALPQLVQESLDRRRKLVLEERERQAALDRAQAAEALARQLKEQQERELAAIRAAQEIQAQKEIEIRLAEEKKRFEEEGRISEEDIKRIEEAEAKRLAEEKRRAEASKASIVGKKAGKVTTTDSTADAGLTTEKIILLLLLLLAALGFGVCVIFRDKISAQFGKSKKRSMDELLGHAQAPAAPAAPGAAASSAPDSKQDMADLAKQSRMTSDDGVTINKVVIKQDEQSAPHGFVAPEKLDELGAATAVAMPTPPPARISFRKADNPEATPAAESPAVEPPAVPPGGGLKAPGGGLKAPGGGLKAPGQGLSRPANTSTPEQLDEGGSDLITDPNLKPKS